MNCADWIAERVLALGVRHVFGVGGANIEDVFAAVQRRRPALRVVLCKHEHGAGSAADAYARVSGGLGVVLATSGGGAMNLVASLAEARASRSPVLAVIGDPPSPQQGRGAFQDTSALGSVDALAVHRVSAVWWARAETAAEIPALVDQAIAAALERRGPAVLVLAKDLQTAPVDRAILSLAPEPEPAALDLEAVQRAANLLTGRRVVVIAGDEVGRARAEEALTKLVEKLDAEVAATPDGRDAYDNHAPRFLGVAGAMGHDAVGAALAEAEVVVCSGTRLPVLARAGLETHLRALPIVSLGSDRPFIEGTAESVHLAGPLPRTLEALAARIEGRPVGERTPPLDDGPLQDDVPLGLASVARALGRRIALGTILLADAGNTGAAIIHGVRCPRGGRWLVAMGMGGMGWTYGAAIGAASASGRHCVAVTGDGAFFMHGLEVHTALEHRLPITWVVVDNRAHGMCLVRERLLLGENAGYNTFGRARLAAGLGVMFPGLATFTCATAHELERALYEAQGLEGPSVVVAELPEVEVPPFAAFQTALREGTTSVPRGGT